MVGHPKQKKRLLTPSKQRTVIIKKVNSTSRKPEINGIKNPSEKKSKQKTAIITSTRKRKGEDETFVPNRDGDSNETRSSKRRRITIPFRYAEREAQTTINIPVRTQVKTKTAKVSKKEPSKLKVVTGSITNKKVRKVAEKSRSKLSLKKKVASLKLADKPKRNSRKGLGIKPELLTLKKRPPKKIVVPDDIFHATNDDGGTVLTKKKRASTKKALQPKLYVTEYKKEPTFETDEVIPFVSTLAHSRLLIRAVTLSNIKLLKALVHDKKSVCSFTVPRSLNINRDAFSYALEKQNLEAINILLNSKLTENLAHFPDVILSDERTGYNSTMMFGHALRRVTVGRGGKEGNNALLKDRSIYTSYQKCVDYISYDIVKEALAFGFPKPLIQKLCETFPLDLQSTIRSNFYNGVVYAIRAGHNRLAGELVEDALAIGGYGFNLLLKEVLLNTTEPLTPFKSVSTIKKVNINDRITPIHCAATNPNSAYLTALLNSRPDYGVVDTQNWGVIHYAAVCTGTGPLQTLLARGISTQPCNRNGDTPLHLASALGRLENVQLILQNEKENDENDNDNDVPKDIAGTLINRTNKTGQTALHKAAEAGQVSVVKFLLSYGADASKFTPARYDKLTPFMLAAQHGHVDVLKLLVQHGVKIDIVDHKGRTALTHAVVNGQGHVVSYLLRIGANHLQKDTSGNTLVHYAAAYGWYFCLNLLIEAGCPANEPNDWKMTPVAISFMKGHIGLVEHILKQPGVDINSRVNDSTGVTLLLQAVASKPTSEFCSRIKFLLLQQNANANIADFEGNNAFHYLVKTEYREKSSDTQYEHSQTQKFVFQAMKLLWDHKCDPCALNSNQESVVFLAVKYGCFSILKKLFDLSCPLPQEPNKNGNTLLHAIVKQVQTDSATDFCNRCMKDATKLQIMKNMANTYNKFGYTPLLWLFDQVAAVVDKKFVRNIINFLDFLVNKLEADTAATDRMKKSGQSVLHLASQVSYAEEALNIILNKRPPMEVLNHALQTPLALAIINGKEQAAKALLNAGANINFNTRNGESLLLRHALNQTKSFHLIPLMIDKGANIHEVNQFTKNSILHYICKKPHLPFAVESIRKLLEKNININAMNKDGRTALHLAVNFRAGETDTSYDVEDVLIESNAKINIRDIRGRIPLHMAFVKIGKPLDGTFMDPIELVTTLVRAMKHSLPNFDDEIKLADEFGSTPLHYAAVRGATISCSYLLSETKGPIDMQDKNGNTPFGLAVLNGHEGCALQFQQKGANFIQTLNTNLSRDPFIKDPDIPWQWEFFKLKKAESDRKKFDKENYPILQEVVRKDWQGILHLMLEKLNSSGVDASFAIAAAINTNRLKLTRKLINRARPSELVVNENCENILHVLAKNEFQNDTSQDLIKQIVEILVSKEVAHAALDQNQSTALIYAAVNRNLVLCNVLRQISLNSDAELRYVDKFGRTPFTASFWKINRKTELSTEWKLWLESLLAQGALVNIGCRYPIIIHPYPGVRYLNCESQVNITSVKYSPLMMAIIAGNYSIVKWLLTLKDTNVDVNFQDDKGRTALMHAARLNDIKMVRLILSPNTYDHSKDNNPWKTITSVSHQKKPLYLNVKDEKGWTVMDHVVAVHDGNYFYATSDAIVRVLYTAGDVINQKSGDGISPLERAIKMKRFRIVNCMEELLGLSKDKRTKSPKITEDIFNIQLNDNSCYSVITNYSKDCQSMTERLIETNERIDFEKDYDLVEPDDLVTNDSSEELKVIFDSEQVVHFSCCLTKVDISYGVNGIYNFYKMQVLKQVRKEMIFLFTRWGRVGDDGQYQKTPFPSEEEAIKEYKKIFRSKTGNTCDNLEAFTPLPKKYRLVGLDTKEQRKPLHVKIDFDKFKNTQSHKKTNLPVSLVKLMENLTEVHKTNTKFSGFDDKYDNELPFGSLTFETLKKGAAILQQIEEIIKKREESKFQPSYSINQISFMESVLKPCEDFYALIPVYGFSKEKLKPIFDLDDLREKQKVIHKLIHLEFASQLLIAAQFNLETVNPFEYIFRCLNTKLEVLVEEQEESQLILQYIHNTSINSEFDSKPPKIIRIFRIERAGEKEQMEKNRIGNSHLLWHGTSAVNILSILHRGLLVTPLEANLSGSLFGKGIYFSDMFMKSTNYTNGSNPKYMFLCEVALGKIHPVKLHYWAVTSNKPLPPTCHSLKTTDSKWEPDPASTLLWKGRTVALGRPIENILPKEQYHGLDYNEFVVFNEEQVRLRYLIQFEDKNLNTNS